MNCLNCNSKFNTINRTPRILVNCGHSFCELCLISILNNLQTETQITCPLCGVQTTFLDNNISHLPKNLALIDSLNITTLNEPSTSPCNLSPSKKNNSTSFPSNTKILCSLHSKDLEAFCETDKRMLCVSCIIGNDHKNHELNSIDKAAQKERAQFDVTFQRLLDMEKKMKEYLNQLENQIISTKEYGEINCRKIEAFFSRMKAIIERRESQLKNTINRITETEYENLIAQKEQVIKQLGMIETIKNEKEKIENLTEFEILLKTRDTRDMIKDIFSFMIPANCNKNNKEFELNQEEEIALCKNSLGTLCPKKSKIIASEKVITNTFSASRNFTQNENTNSNSNSNTTPKSIFPSRPPTPSEAREQRASMKHKSNTLKLMKASEKSFVITSGKNSAKNLTKVEQPSSPSETTFKFSSKHHCNEQNLSSRKEDQSQALFPSFRVKSTDLKKIVKERASSVTNTLNSENDQRGCSDEQPADEHQYSSGQSEEKVVPSVNANIGPIDNNNEVLCSAAINNAEIIINTVEKNEEMIDLTSKIDLNPIKFEEGGQRIPMDQSDINLMNPMTSIQQDLASLYREFNETILLLGGKSDYCVRKYNVDTYTWSILKKSNSNILSIERSDFVAVMYKEKKALIMGGRVSSTNGSEVITDSIELLNTGERSLKKLDIKLKHARCSFGSVYVNSRLYVAGGFNGKDVLDNCEYFEQRTKKWIDLPKMSQKKREFSMILGPDKCICVIGGLDEKDNVLKSVEKFDVDKGIWIKMNDMNQNRKGCSAVCMPDGFYVMGGFDGCQYLKSVEKFDFVSKKWKYVEDMTYPKCFFAAVPSTDFQFIYTFGGYNGKPIDCAERYDVVSSRWEPLDKMSSAKYKHQCISLVND